jgi:uncharacterized protein
VTVHELSRADARRIAVRAQLLDSMRPAGLLDVVRHLTLLQIDPTAAIAPNADLVAWSRLGASYSPAELRGALENRTLVELRAMIRPSEDLALYRADMACWRQAEPGEAPGWRAVYRDWVRANDACRRDILLRLASSGPLSSRDLPDTCKVPWQSTGWSNNRNVSKLLDLMVVRGEVAIAGRSGGDRLWDLAERVYPDDPVVPADEALRTRNERRLRALGIARARGPECPVEPLDVGEAGEPAVVEDVKGTWRVDPSLLASRSRGARRCCRPSTGSSMTASGQSSSSSSITSSRCTSPPPSAGGGTSRSRSFTATGWWESSTPPLTAERASCGSMRSTKTTRSPRP